MSMIPDEIVEQVRDSADLVAIIGEAVELKRTGSDYRGPCPFHGGTHRNFAVIPKKGRYYCFVCHESGDVFSWLMKRLGMDYPTAVREVRAARRHRHSRAAGRAGPDPLEPLYRRGGGGPGLVHPAAAGVAGGQAGAGVSRGPRASPRNRPPCSASALRRRARRFSRRWRSWASSSRCCSRRGWRPCATTAR